MRVQHGKKGALFQVCQGPGHVGEAREILVPYEDFHTLEHILHEAKSIAEDNGQDALWQVLDAFVEETMYVGRDYVL